MRILLVALLLSSTLHAGVSIITGQIKDAQGNPINGSLVMRLPQPAQDPTTQSAIAPIPVTFQLINGNVTGGAPLYDLATIQPQKLWYSARAYDTTGALVFYGNYYVTGSVFNIGAATPTVVTTSNISFASIPTGSSGFGTPVPNSSTIQSTINAVGVAGTGAPIVVPQGYTGSGNFTNTSFLPILNYTPSPNGDYDKNGVQPVDIFGVRHDGQHANCNTTSGSAIMICSSQPNPFTQADVGKLVLVYGNGPSSQTHGGFVAGTVTALGGSGGTNGLQSIISTNGGCIYPMRGWVTVAGGAVNGAFSLWQAGYGCTSLPTTATVATVTGTITLSGTAWVNVDLPTSIISVQNATTVTLADAASVTGGTDVMYGTDDYLALQAACNGRGLAQNGGHFTHVGISMISQGPVCDGNNTWIQGAGWAPLGNNGGGSNIVYAGKNPSGKDGIWNTSQGWGAMLTDMGLRGNSLALPRGLRIINGSTPKGNGNSANGIYQRLWIGWMYGDGVGPANVGNGIEQLSKGIYADVATGNGDFNKFSTIFIAGAVHGIDGNNDQATAWIFPDNLQIQHSYVGICSFNGTAINNYFTEFLDTDIVLGPCDASNSGAPIQLSIQQYGGESSAQSIKWSSNNASNSPTLSIASAAIGTDVQHIDPSGIMVDLSSSINAGAITLGAGGSPTPASGFAVGTYNTSGKIKLPIFNNGFGPTLTLNTNVSPENIVQGPSTCGGVCGNVESTVLTYNGRKMVLDAADYSAITPLPWLQNDYEGTLRNFGSTSLTAARPPGQTDYAPQPFYGWQGLQIGATGSTVYNYQFTCSDQQGNETAPAPTISSGFPWQIQTADGVVVRITTGPASLNTSNYFKLGFFYLMRGCAYYNLYGDNGIGGTIGYLTTLTRSQYAANGNYFFDQGQYTKTARVPPPLHSTSSGSLTVEGPTVLSRLNPADRGTCTMAAGTCGAITFPSGATYNTAPTCYATYTGTGTLAGTIKIASTTTTVTPASTTGTDTAQVNWACLGN